MVAPDVARAYATTARWLPSVALGTAATAAAAGLFGAVAGLLVGLTALATTLSAELLELVQTRSRGLRDEMLERLATVQTERTDETLDARSHDPCGHVRRTLADHGPHAGAAPSLAHLEATLARVDGRLRNTEKERRAWLVSGPPALIGGLASSSEAGIPLKRYGDPINVPPWLAGPRAQPALLRVGGVLDDIRLLPSAEIEWAVLTFTLWARALLLVLAPALGVLSLAPPPDLDGDWVGLAPWALALAFALTTALLAPRIATLTMQESVAGLHTRRALLAFELPLAITLALTCPGWAAVAFAAGWTNWWQRLGRTPAIPDFSWLRLAGWITVTAGAQAAGLVVGPGEVVWWHAIAEVAITLGVIAVIGGSYGAMLPVSAGVAIRVLVLGTRHQRLADSDAQALVDELAETMTRAADELDALTPRRPADVDTANVLRVAVDSMRPVVSRRKRTGPPALGALVGDALAEAGHDMWVGDPRAQPAQDRARRDCETLPVLVGEPEFEHETIATIVVPEDVAGLLHRLLVACIVEARVHGSRRVRTIVARDGDRIEIRISNPPAPGERRGGRGRGARTIRALAERLPGAGDLFRGSTDYSFVGRRPAGELYGVRFSFTVGDTAPDADPPGSRM